MIRVLQCVNNMHRAGLETVLMNYYRNIDRTKIQFDFLTHRPEESDYDAEIISLGGRIYHAPRLYPWNYPSYFAYMKQFFREHPEYQIVLSHIDAMSYLPLLAAKRAGVPVRIAHSHSTGIDRDYKYLLKQFFRYQLPTAANNLCTCGVEAGKFLFRGREAHWVPNAIDAERFVFAPDIRVRKRWELGLGNALTLGHIGRFSPEKNHGFLLELFASVLKQEPDSVLLLAGAGETELEIRQKAKDMGLEERVRFLGKRSDVNELYQAMDVFVMPSLYEGVPVVGIEAQFAGLPCVLSDRVPREVAFTPLCRFVELESSAGYWAEQVLLTRQCNREAKSVSDSVYDASRAARNLEAYYEQLLSNLAE